MGGGGAVFQTSKNGERVYRKTHKDRQMDVDSGAQGTYFLFTNTKHYFSDAEIG